MNNQTARSPRGRPELKVNPEQEAIIKMYAERVGEKIGRLVSEIIVDSLTLLWAEKPASQPSVVIREQPTSDSLLNAVEIAK